MSREEMFDGLEDLDIPRQELHYEEGKWEFYRKEVDTLVELLLDRTLAHWGGEYLRTDARKKRAIHQRDEIIRTESVQPMLRKRADKVAEILPEDADPSAFIDCLLFAVHRSEYEPNFSVHGANDRQCFLNDLLDPVVQVFYDRGHNDFLIDLSMLTFEPESIARGLIGREDEPLRVTYKGNVDNFANFVSDCDLTLEGKVSGNFVGESGRGNFRSKISFDYGKNAYKLCIGSYQTEFHFEAMPWMKAYIGSISTSEECTFYVRRKPCYDRMALLKEEGFFGRFSAIKKRRRNGNRLYHRQGRGWTEVRPE